MNGSVKQTPYFLDLTRDEIYTVWTMKIVHVLPKYRHSNWEAIPNTTCLSFDNIVWYRAMKEYKGGIHTVIPFWCDVPMIERGKAAMNRELLETMEREKPDLAFFHAGDDIEIETMKKITALGVPSLYWTTDDSWRFWSVSRYFAPYFTWTATNRSALIAEYAKLGVKAILSHEGINPKFYQPLHNIDDQDIDVSFVGTYNPERGKVIKGLQAAGIEVYVRGKGWPEGELATQEDVVKIMARSKISLILNPPSFYIGVKPLVRLFFKRPNLGTFWRPFRIQPDFWNFADNVRELLGKRNLQVKARHFETLACRTLGMTRYADSLDKFYEIGKEIVVYQDIPDLIEKIRYYLEHKAERQKIAQAGYERTIADHTVEKRLDQIFGTMEFKQ